MNQLKARGTGVLSMALICLGCSFGCSQSTGSGGISQGADSKGPDAVVQEFLEAVRTGDDHLAAQLLTPLARQKTSEMEMVVAPPGSDTAKFKLGEVKYRDQGAQVATEWTDLDSDGQPHTDQIVWILHAEPIGWRISGMITRVFDDQEPVVLNFEDPREMLLKQQQVEEELARRVGGQRQAESSAPGSIR